MSVRRGCQRIYVVLTVGWVALWLYVWRPAQLWPEPEDIAYYKYIRFDHELIPVETLRQLNSHEKTELARRWLTVRTNYEVTDSELYSLTDHKAYGLSLDEYRDNVLLLLGVKTYASVWVSSLWRIWRRNLVAAIVPSAFFYFLFFYVCRWVYRGFKRDQTARPVETTLRES